MAKKFNTLGVCSPDVNYMVDLTSRLEQIKRLVDAGNYFTINRARQYGKTTTLRALKSYLANDYGVISMDFQGISNTRFRDEKEFCVAFTNQFVRVVNASNQLKSMLDLSALLETSKDKDFALDSLFNELSILCNDASKPLVLFVDEVDSATNNQIFLDFLSQLRYYYLHRDQFSTFQSVILAGVYDIKNIKRKIRTEDGHRTNSPWNIAADFDVVMSFNRNDIEGMLKEYETDYHTGMHTEEISQYIYDSTSGYPFLVSRLCQLIDEKVAETIAFPAKSDAWTKAGYIEAEKMLVHESNALFESVTDKLEQYSELKNLVKAILFEGKNFTFASTDEYFKLGFMFGFFKVDDNNNVAISNRIFETVIYNHLLTQELVNSVIYNTGVETKNQFIVNGRLNMKLVLERFVVTFSELYKDSDDTFVEEMGRKYFMLFIRPIINGTGHYYIEARTRDMKRTDMIVDYAGEQFVVEMKIWRGENYHKQGEDQIKEYLDFYGVDTGYMLIFNFNKNKETGMKEVQYQGKTVYEATV